MPHLRIRLAPHPEGLRVASRLTDLEIGEGGVVGQLPHTIAGAPTIVLDDEALAAVDDDGPLRLVSAVEDDEEDGPVRRWRTDRSTVGPIELSYLARFPTEEPRPATAPLELRREGAGFSGAAKCFLVLPHGPEELAFEVGWDASPVVRSRFVSSLGEIPEDGGALTGTGRDMLGDTYVMGGDLAGSHHREGEMSMWWLTAPGFDVDSFSVRLGQTYQLLAHAFDVPAHPYRVFLRTHPHRGASASAHPASFVMAMNPEQPLDELSIYETLAHELVHEWLRLDGPEDEVTWFVEGSADYYSLVLPFRAGLLDEDAFLRAVNLESRMGYASPRRHLSLSEASSEYFSDVLAHRLPYVRGMFYLADLDARVRQATSSRRDVDDIVRDVVRRRRDGERVGLVEWCALVEEVLGGDEKQVLDSMVFTGSGRPGDGVLAPGLESHVVDVPVLELGFDFSTFVTGRVTNLEPGSPAARAGLEEGDAVEMPRYTEALALETDDVLEIRATRQGRKFLVTVPMDRDTAPVRQWRTRTDSGGGER